MVREVTISGREVDRSQAGGKIDNSSSIGTGAQNSKQHNSQHWNTVSRNPEFPAALESAAVGHSYLDTGSPAASH